MAQLVTNRGTTNPPGIDLPSSTGVKAQAPEETAVDDAASMNSDSDDSESAYFSSPEMDEEASAPISSDYPDVPAVIARPEDNMVLGGIFRAPPVAEDSDLLSSFKGLYRILDLISEPGSGGLVDKVIISQDSLKDFINALSPDAYHSLTRVDFKALDQLQIQPLGLYGSPDEIVNFLASHHSIDRSIVAALERSMKDATAPCLRSGLYLLRTFGKDPKSGAELLFAIYWPEATTWNDNAILPVRRNRVTFMRYLTKICDQVVCLISSEHAQSIVWSDESEDADTEHNDRMFKFEVAKTHEQDEAVEVRRGFKIDDIPFLPEQSHEIRHGPSAIDLRPRLTAGECSQGLLVFRYKPPGLQERNFGPETFSSQKLRTLLECGVFRLNPALGDDTVDFFMLHGLQVHYRKALADWKSRKAEFDQTDHDSYTKEIADMERIQDQELPQLERILRQAVIDRVSTLFPYARRRALLESSDEDIKGLRDQFSDLVLHYPQIQSALDQVLRDGQIPEVQPRRQFTSAKQRLINLRVISREDPDLGGDELEDVLRRLCDDSDGHEVVSSQNVSSDGRGVINIALDAVVSVVSLLRKKDQRSQRSVEHHIRDEVNRLLKITSDSQFLSDLEDLHAFAGEQPILEELIDSTVVLADKHLRTIVEGSSQQLAQMAVSIRKEALRAQLNYDREQRRKEFGSQSRYDLVKDMDLTNKGSANASKPCMLIDVVDAARSSCKISGRLEHMAEAALECTLYSLVLTADDRENLQADPTYIPSPQLHPRSAQVFNLKPDQRILHAQIIGNGELLLVIEDPHYLLIFLASTADIGNAVSRQYDGARKHIRREKVGLDPIIAYDEPKRTLCICATSELALYLYPFDEHHGTLYTGDVLKLADWYNGRPVISHCCFVCGGEAILLIDSRNEARVFSLVTRQFRPAALTLLRKPIAAYSSPDGACLLLSYRDETGVVFRAHHWSTFGSSDGHDLGYLDVPEGHLAVTSLVNRASIHLFGIDHDARHLRSVALDITKKSTEFMFKETDLKSSVKIRNNKSTSHNCLIDCHVDVWTRFPVVATIQRQTITPSRLRLPRKLLFSTDREHDRYPGHFTDLVFTFEKTTKKPTGYDLKRMVVSALNLGELRSLLVSDNTWDVSHFCAGEWLVDLLCMIPIQIAVTRENKFLPLKDGVVSAALERDLLGAEVGQIVDALSFSWYESLFQSYMVSKPVKVISSMGEQSVGKSFSLNHFVDTSFAGSAMRTTEGVWMSVTPTNDALIVALDFEGVHSIERSAQEDTLLVLFNTAISNLILFRNNFVISRSIAGLFQSFQSSSTILDPAANPQLFRSTLVIIIKDVVDSDKREIVREFRTKFQKIVEDEQDANFISRLHRGQLNITPWPVIESKQFYTLFSSLKECLDQQDVTHRTAGEFLYTLKTLMAKLKANDWGALSQTLAGHRAQKLRDYLHNALEFGFCEMEPTPEPLKNLDTDDRIDKADTPSRFFISVSPLLTSEQKTERANLLTTLQRSWDGYDIRYQQSDAEWVEKLSFFLAQLAQTRVERVFEWISSNLSRFKSNHVNMEFLRREYESAALDLTANVEICGMTCASCLLLCLLSRRHDSNEPHNCQTSHRCVQPCEFQGDHPDLEKTCGYRAGHSGKHICVVEDHLCGEVCDLKGKNGCLDQCIKVFGHSPKEGHMCSARVHACGEPCRLRDVKLADNNYSCPRTCTIPSEKIHDVHVCNTQSCPMTCDLCKMLCSNPDHLHALEAGAMHLCGQQHNCPALCSAEGICQIDTTPQSVEATFTGRHETFQYTKYSQVAKRLPCVIFIPAGEHGHGGPHIHSTDPSPFHFCNDQCVGCGYFCTLPRGHSQQEHVTNHGSMSKTTWAVDGPDDTIVELKGRSFASNDDGAPMLCNLLCQDRGRHVHVDYCRAGGSCDDPEIEHIPTRLTPKPDIPKDWVSHSLFWRRSGFKDPYSRDDQLNFAKCDSFCPGPEHARSQPPQPSYCTLPIFHPPSDIIDIGQGYVSNDGHVFSCENPAEMHQTYHVMYVIDKSSSMTLEDRRPLPDTPWTARIAAHANNRLGAVYSALNAFWESRRAILNPGHQRGAHVPRDANTVILFDRTAEICIANDAISTPNELTSELLRYGPGRGTNFTAALSVAEAAMQEYWDADRPPILIFLSDGECNVPDLSIQSLAHSAIALGSPLSLQSVLFGRNTQSGSLRRMSNLAREIQSGVPHDPMHATILSSFSAALDTVHLTQAFLDFADSMRKPRGSLLHEPQFNHFGFLN